MTLWKLVQGWNHYWGEGKCEKSGPSFCHRCTIEQWAREKAKEYRGLDEEKEYSGLVWAAMIMDDLGVPEEK